MSALYLKLMAVLCLSRSALSGPGSSGVEWRDFGGAVTIQCRPPETGQESMSLKKGLGDKLILYKNGKEETHVSDAEFRDRLELTGVFPNLDILIKNLTSNDTGPYWCIYSRYDSESDRSQNVKGVGSVLLVVTADAARRCEQSDNRLVLGSVVVCAAALSGVIIVFLIWLIHKQAKMRTAKQPQRVASSDVYEDMRGTIRR